MNIDKAIEILTDIVTYVEHGDPPEEHDAITLGIEALKRVKAIRDKKFPVMGEELPGETK